MDTYHALSYQNVLYSGKRRYLTQYVEKYPLPDPKCEASQRVIAYVKNALQKKQDIEQGVVDRLVYESFGVDPYLQK